MQIAVGIMPLKNQRLTPRERVFSQRYAETGSLAFASQKAGYASSSGGVNALKRPSIQERIQKIREERVPGLLTLALDTIEDVMRDKSAPASSRVAASDKALKTARQYVGMPDAEKTLDGMSLSEIERDTFDKMAELLVELRPGEFGPVVVDEELEDEPPEDEAAAVGEREGIFG